VSYRLDKILTRNREAPRRLKRTALLVGGFLLLLVVLYVFVYEPPPPPLAPLPPSSSPGEHSVRDVPLMRPKPRPDAGM
jgi:hypothetical protein